MCKTSSSFIESVVDAGVLDVWVDVIPIVTDSSRRQYHSLCEERWVSGGQWVECPLSERLEGGRGD